MKRFLFSLMILVFCSLSIHAEKPLLLSPQPISCITSQFTGTGDQYWKAIALQLSNHCGKAVDFQNSTITFNTTTSINTAFWGDFTPLSYPDNNLIITSAIQPDKTYLATLNLHFPVDYGTTILPSNQSITINYGVANDQHIDGTTQVYLNSPIATGTLTIKNNSSKPSNVTQSYSLVHLTSNGQLVSNIQLPWNNITNVPNLAAQSYTLSADTIIASDGTNYQGTVTPNIFTVSPNQMTTVVVTYSKVQPTVTLNVSGAPSNLTSLKINFTPNDNSMVVTKTVALNKGMGSDTVSLSDGVIYTISTDPVSGYAINISPQQLTTISNAKVAITLTPTSTNTMKIISYVPGWKTPPPAQDLAKAGYTHLIVAFGVFSTNTPGMITPAFDTVSKEYIQSLHQAGIKVLLSLGGASTSLPNTSVDFHQVLTAASSIETFTQTFITSLKSLIDNYQFDGFDIDIEHGINAGGTFTNPLGDIAVLAQIINTMHQQYPSLLISLAPQVANISATSGYDQTWGNYAALIEQTYSALSWVGIQLYNTGCAYGINQVCYAPQLTSPDFSVAMATDLLADWPTNINGRPTGFQPYMSHLEPSQIVLGYPAPDASGASDGSPVTPTTTIKRAIQCLKTAIANNLSCDTYIPPKAYGAIGGVFNWEITYDQNNGYKFAMGLNQ